eukprot:15205714-Heterocapsa_arctica.AAC.1
MEKQLSSERDYKHDCEHAPPAPATPAPVSQADLAEAKGNAELLTLTANKLASKGLPPAAAMELEPFRKGQAVE